MELNLCSCGNKPHIVGYFIKGVANKKNWFIKCDNCMTRTRHRNTPSKAVDEWNQYEGELFKKER